MPRPALPTLDPAPLRAVIARRHRTYADLAYTLNVDIRAVEQAMNVSMAWENADRYAIALGVHPWEIWGDAWWDVAKAYDALYTHAEQGALERRRMSARLRRSAA